MPATSATINGWILEGALVRSNRILFPKRSGSFEILQITETGLFNPADLTGEQKEGRTFFLPAQIVMGALVLGLLGSVVNALLLAAERRLFRWREAGATS